MGFQNPISVALPPSTAYYGNGSAGAVTVPAGTTRQLTTDLHTTTLVVEVGATLRTAGYKVYATVGITNNGTIHNDAMGSDPYGGGAGGLGGTLGSGGYGGSLTNTNGESVNPSIAGAGNAGTSGTNPDYGVAGGTVSGGPLVPALPLGQLNLPSNIRGGSGGGCSDRRQQGGWQPGGGGGGIVLLAAPIITNNGVISAKGGDVANAQNGGVCGGGGGGGMVVLVYGTRGGTGNVDVRAGRQANGQPAALPPYATAGIVVEAGTG